jgi:hypothetical protein
MDYCRDIQIKDDGIMEGQNLLNSNGKEMVQYY